MGQCRDCCCVRMECRGVMGRYDWHAMGAYCMLPGKEVSVPVAVDPCVIDDCLVINGLDCLCSSKGGVEASGHVFSEFCEVAREAGFECCSVKVRCCSFSREIGGDLFLRISFRSCHVVLRLGDVGCVSYLNIC